MNRSTRLSLIISVSITAWLCFVSRSLSQTTSTPASKPTGSGTAKSNELENIDLLSLDIPVVVTASRHEQKLTTVPYAVSIITAEDIRAAGARNVPDALRLATGIDISEISYSGAAVNIRGQHELLSREVLVLVDGRQIFDSFFGGTHWSTWPFQLEDIARIEVIRGPAGVTWGPNAMNGVINVITKDPRDQLGLTFTGAGGTQSFNKEHLGYGFQSGKLRMRVSGEYEGTSGFQKGGSFLRSLDDDIQAGRSTLHAIYDASPNDTITFSGGNATINGGFPQAPFSSLLHEMGSSMISSYMLGRWDHKIADDNRISLNSYVNDVTITPLSGFVRYHYDQFALQLNQTFKPADNHTLTWGIDGRSDILDATNLLTENFLGTGIVGLYAQDEWHFAPRWTFSLGGRIDYDFYHSFNPSARAALSYELSSTSLLYGAVSRAYQAPPLGVSRFNTAFADGLFYLTSDPGLKPETLIAYELGYRAQFFERLHTNVNLFCHTYEDMNMLQLLPGPPGLMRKNVANGYSACMYGVELDAKYAVNKQLTLLGNYTFQILGESGDTSIFDTERMSPPKNKFMIGTQYTPIDPLRLSAYLYYVDNCTSPDPNFPLWRRNIDSYFRLDLRAEYEFWKDHGSVAVGVRNLLDPNHPEGASQYQAYSEVPRMIYAEMRLTFK